DGTYKNGSGIERWYDGDIDKMNSERFPSATAKEYAELMQKINSRTYFSKEVQTYLHPLLEGIMENPANKQWLQHAGKKGGSTAYILTDAMYATTKEGTRTELAVFF
ncbi:D-alanyl-D-alanine carboxypeptidase, partial [Cohnella sp. REN36]|nr:D-alanyl-D-alanine carboxypeptidase [Cohnella sp. REN36]